VVLAAILVATIGFILLRPSPYGAVAMTTANGSGFSVVYPIRWAVDTTVAQPTDVVLLIRDPSPAGSFDPGLIMRRTPDDPHPIDQDLPGLVLANHFQYPDIVVLRKGNVSVQGGKEARLVVSQVKIGGETERIIDIVVRTPSNVAYHLQAIAPPDVLTDASIVAMVAGLRVS
jgi:hypothetical protein